MNEFYNVIILLFVYLTVLLDMTKITKRLHEYPLRI